MKKQFYLLILLIAVFFSTRAQTTVVNQLQIKTVPTDTTATDVLVRGADRKVKKVPISFLQSTPLPTPSLQEVLDRNQYASGRLIGLSFGTYGTPFYENLYMGAPYGFYNTKGVYGTDSYKRVELSSDNGLYLKTSSLGNGFLKFKADNLENNEVVLQSPKLSGIIPISVNGNYADQDGNITINTSSTVSTIQDVIDASPNLDGYGASIFGKSLNFDNEFSGFKRKISVGSNQIDIYSYETSLYYPISRLNLSDSHIQHISINDNISKSYKLST